MGRYRVLTLTQPLSRGVLQHTARAVTGLVLAGLVVAAAPVAAQDTSSQRNMVFILTDDQRFDGLGLLNEYFETPNLDTLAEGGVVFATPAGGFEDALPAGFFALQDSDELDAVHVVDPRDVRLPCDGLGLISQFVRGALRRPI